MQEAQTKKALKGCSGCLGLLLIAAVLMALAGLILSPSEGEIADREDAQLEATAPPVDLGPQTRELPGPFAVNLDEETLVEAAGTPVVRPLADIDDGYGYRFVSSDGPYVQIQFHSNRVIVAWHVFPEAGFEAQNEQALSTARRILATAIGAQTGPAAVDASVNGFIARPSSALADVYVGVTSESGLGMVTIHPKAAPYVMRR